MRTYNNSNCNNIKSYANTFRPISAVCVCVCVCMREVLLLVLFCFANLAGNRACKNM